MRVWRPISCAYWYTPTCKPRNCPAVMNVRFTLELPCRNSLVFSAPRLASGRYRFQLLRGNGCEKGCRTFVMVREEGIFLVDLGVLAQGNNGNWRGGFFFTNLFDDFFLCDYFQSNLWNVHFRLVKYMLSIDTFDHRVRYLTSFVIFGGSL